MLRCPPVCGRKSVASGSPEGRCDMYRSYAHSLWSEAHMSRETLQTGLTLERLIKRSRLHRLRLFRNDRWHTCEEWRQLMALMWVYSSKTPNWRAPPDNNVAVTSGRPRGWRLAAANLQPIGQDAYFPRLQQRCLYPVTYHTSYNRAMPRLVLPSDRQQDSHPKVHSVLHQLAIDNHLIRADPVTLGVGGIGRFGDLCLSPLAVGWDLQVSMLALCNIGKI